MLSQYVWPLLQGFPPPPCFNWIVSLPWCCFSYNTTLYQFLPRAVISLPVQLALAMPPASSFRPRSSQPAFSKPVHQSLHLALLSFDHPTHHCCPPFYLTESLGCHRSPVQSLTALSSLIDLTLSTFQPSPMFISLLPLPTSQKHHQFSHQGPLLQLFLHIVLWMKHPLVFVQLHLHF